MMKRGELMFFNNNIDAAIKAFQQAASLDPTLWQAHLNLVNMYIQKNDFPAAIVQCREVLKAKPDHKDVHLILGNLLRAQNDLDGAMKELHAALEAGAPSAATHYAIAMCHLQKGESFQHGTPEHKEHYANAEEHLLAGLEKQPKYPNAHLAMSVVKFKQDKKAEALAELDVAIKLKSKYPEAHNAKGDMLQVDKKIDEALEEYKKAVEEEPKYAQAYFNIANIYYGKGDYDLARSYFQIGREFNPNIPDVFPDPRAKYPKLNLPDRQWNPYPAGDFLKPDGTSILQNSYL